MDSFYNTVLIVALVLLILGLTYSGYLLYYYQFADVKWPEMKGSCPDTWVNTGKTQNGKQQCMVGHNSPNTGKDNIAVTNPESGATIDGITIYAYNAPFYQFEKDVAKCDLKVWADTHGINWDGVTNYNNC